MVMTQTLTVNETFNLGRGGILTLSNGRLQQPTNVVLPGAPAGALQADNNRNQITLDDSNLTQNPDPIVYPPPGLTALNTVRSGDSSIVVHRNAIGQIVTPADAPAESAETGELAPDDDPEFGERVSEIKNDAAEDAAEAEQSSTEAADAAEAGAPKTDEGDAPKA